MPKPTNSKKDITVFIGVDPGKKGGLVLRIKNQVWTCPMPDTERGIWKWFASASRGSATFAVIEKVHSMPEQGVVSSFTFGTGYGGLRMALTAAHIPFEEINPRTWQKALGISPRKKTETQRQFKLRLLTKAQQLYPTLEVWDGTREAQLSVSDALLLADYAAIKSRSL